MAVSRGGEEDDDELVDLDLHCVPDRDHCERLDDAHLDAVHLDAVHLDDARP